MSTPHCGLLLPSAPSPLLGRSLVAPPLCSAIRPPPREEAPRLCAALRRVCTSLSPHGCASPQAHSPCLIRKHHALNPSATQYLSQKRGNTSTEGWCLCAGFRGTRGVAQKKTNRPLHVNARRGGGRSAGGVLATECERVEQVHKLKVASPTLREIESCDQPSSLASLLPSEPNSILALASSRSIRRPTG